MTGRIMHRTVRVVVAAISLGVVGWSYPAAQQLGHWQIQFNTASGAHDSTNFSEPFAVQVNLFEVLPNMPATIKVTLSNGKGQNQELTLTRYKDTKSYISQTITVDQGAQATGLQSYAPGGLSRSVDPVKVENGGTMTVFNGDDSASIAVYQNASKQGIARTLAAMDMRSEELSRLSLTARDAITAIDKQLKTETDPGVVGQLQKARAELVRQRDIAMRESAALAEGRRLMQEPTQQDLPMWRYTDQFKLAMAKEFLALSRDPYATPIDWKDAFDRGVRIATMQWDEVYQQFVIDYVRGWYEATASLSLAGPTLTLFGGKTIYWKDATLGERLSAFKDLAVAVAMIKGLPKVVDITGEKLAGEIGGYKGNTAFGEIVISGSGGTSRAGEVGRAGVPNEPARATGAASEPVRTGGAGNQPAGASGAVGRGPTGLAPDLVVNKALSEAATDSFNRAAEAARANGLSEADVQAIVDDTMAKVDAADPGQPKNDALARGELDLADRVFEAKYPGVRAISDVNTLELIRTVRVKAALEAQGKAQIWTPAERAMLDSLNTPEAQTAFESEDPFGLSTGDATKDIKTTMNGLDANSEPGYTPILDETDVKNIKAAAKKPLKVVDTPNDPVIDQKLKDFRAKQAEKAKSQATPTGQGGKGQTQVLKPGEVKNTFTPRKPMLDLRTLKNEIVNKRLQAAKKTVTGNQSPLAGERGQGVGNADANRIGNALDVNKVTAEQIKALTPDELRRITPLEIRDMPAEARQALPLEQMNAPQLRAIAEAEGIPTGVINAGTGMEGPAGGAAGQSQKQKNEENNKILGDIGRAMVNDEPAPKKTASSGMSPNLGTGTLAVNVDGTLGLTPFPGAPIYPGAFTANFGINLFAPGTDVGSSTGTPLFVTDPFVIPLNRFAYKADGSIVYSGLNISGLGAADPTRPWVVAGGSAASGTLGGDTPGFPVWSPPVPGGLIFTPPAKTATGGLPGGGDSSANVIGGPYPLKPIPLGPPFGFGDHDSFEPLPKTNAVPTFVKTSTGLVEETTPAYEIDLGTDPIGPLGIGPVVSGIQLEIGVLKPTLVPGVSPLEPSRDGLWATLRSLLLPRPGVRAAMGPGWAPRSGSGVTPTSGAAPAKTEAPPEIQAMFVSLGVATGDAFEVTAINGGERPVKIAADAVVLEPLASGGGNQVRKSMQDAITKRGPTAPAPTRAHVSGYCMDYFKQPPTAGGIFRVASAQLQEQFAPLRHVLQAEQRLEQVGKLVPDIDPTEYFHQLRQWAVWTKAQGFTSDTFAKAFVDHAKKNFAAARQPWTKEIESQIASLVPHRWQDITAVLQEATKAGS
jgi:hypothetical protein